MAKAPKATETPAPAPAPQAFNVEWGAPPPVITRGFGGQAREPSVYLAPTQNLAAPANGQYASYFVPVTIPATITDEKERAKAQKDEARKLQNRISSITRRLAKPDANGMQKTFVMRALDRGGTFGVQVWRTEDKRFEPKPAAPAAPAPAAQSPALAAASAAPAVPAAPAPAA